MTITIPATGLLCHTERLAAHIAASATFRSIVGEATALLALNHIPFDWAIESTHTWPRAVVTPRTWEYTKEGNGSWRMEAEAAVTFEFEIPVSAGALTEQDEINWFRNKVGAIIAEMRAAINDNSAYAGETNVDLQSFEELDGPMREELSEDEVPDPSGETTLLPRYSMVFAVRYR